MGSHDAIPVSPGDLIDDFEIAEVIAAGGSSTTFRATHRTLAREVALKFVHPAVFSDDGGAIEAARLDATRVARLEHPGIAPVFAAGFHAGGLYVASAMPKGRTLAELGAERAITPTETARVLADVAAALEAAHAQGVVHRDLRPECVTVDRWGHGVVRDFGVTRTSGRTGLLTRAEVLESLRFTAPELVLGRAATPAADVYELGALAVWCLTGAPPYRDRPAAEFVLFRTTAPAPVLIGPDGTPASTLNTVLKAAMALEPGERPAPEEFAGAFSYAVSRLPAEVAAANCPLTATEAALAPAPPVVAAAPFAVAPGEVAGAVGTPEGPFAALAGATRSEHRRPLPVAAAAEEEPVPWGTYAACAMVAVVLGLAGLLAGRASAPQAPPAIRIGAFSLQAGAGWSRAAATGDSKLVGASLAGAAGETATVGVVAGARLPGDPVAPELLPGTTGPPRAATAGGAGVVTYAGTGASVVARPTSRGTVVALCSRAVPVARCAALAARASGPGRDLPILPARSVSAALHDAMAAVADATGVASAELQGTGTDQSGAAGRLASALRGAASQLELDGLDRGTGAELGRVRAALVAEAVALERLGSAIDRHSDVAFDTASDGVRASRRGLVGALSAFRRAGYPVAR